MNQPAFRFLLILIITRIMTGYWLIMLKTFLRSSVDNYVLPGTATGTDILLIYMTEWKRHFVLVTSATMYFIASQFDLPRIESACSNITSEVQDTETK